LPVGLTFSRKGNVRSEVLVQYGKRVNLTVPAKLDHFEAVELITDRIKQELARSHLMQILGKIFI